MNGELYQACVLVAAVRQALRAGTFSYKGADYEKTIRFTFQNGARADSAADWYRELAARRLRDIKLLAPTVTGDRGLLAFSGGTPFWLPAFTGTKPPAGAPVGNSTSLREVGISSGTKRRSKTRPPRRPASRNIAKISPRCSHRFRNWPCASGRTSSPPNSTVRGVI